MVSGILGGFLPFWHFLVVILPGLDLAAIRSPVVLTSLANGSLKRHSFSNGQKQVRNCNAASKMV